MIQRIKNRIRRLKRSPAYNTFLGVFWALMAYEAIFILLGALQ